MAVNSPVETLPLDQWRRQFEVNLFGHIAMTQALLPALLLSSGTVVNISSVGGKVVLPTYGAYAGSKFALEAASDALRREVAELGIKVVVVEPGAVRTDMAERGITTAEGLVATLTDAQLARYRDLVAGVTAQARSFGEDGVSAEYAAKVIAKAATASRPRTRYTIGRDAAILLWINRVVSDRVLDRIVRQNLRSFIKKSRSGEQRSAATTSRGAA
ncbi:SDR family NAD(P)-dependent oxidoreductase [Mycobacterium sp. M23085]|uniref:SDR family NAD(P)-dependent oxidoreductase n=1 Tax=Mycobacterium sp. M23085 TaxID=3378087 RepID=UPI0038779EBC